MLKILGLRNEKASGNHFRSTCLCFRLIMLQQFGKNDHQAIVFV